MKIFPSPIRPVFAVCAMVSTTFATRSSAMAMLFPLAQTVDLFAILATALDPSGRIRRGKGGVPLSEVLSLEELLAVGAAFVELGVRKIRLTGGEPLVRNNIAWLVERLAALPGLDELVLTTNGARLAALADDLKRAGLKRLNVSLDSLRADRFRELTRTGRLGDVLGEIAGFGPIAQSARDVF